MNRTLKIRFLIIMIIILLGAVILIGINNYHIGNKDRNTLEIKQDIQPILDRFPKVTGIKNCYWVSDVINSDRDSVGPSSYRMKGFIILGKDQADKLMEDYKWETVEEEWEPSISISQVGDIKGKWYYSEDYNNYIVNGSYYGFFYYNIDNNLLFFDVQR